MSEFVVPLGKEIKGSLTRHAQYEGPPQKMTKEEKD